MRKNKDLTFGNSGWYMAVYNIINRSSIKEGNNILAEHYQRERLETEDLLKKISSSKIGHHFIEKTNTIKPNQFTNYWRVYDLPDTINQFLLGGKNPILAEVSSNKKIAKSGNFIISRLRHYLKEMAIIPKMEENIALSTEYLVFESKGEVTPHLLLPFSLSRYVQKILDWAQTGNAHPRFSPITLKNTYLPEVLIEKSNYFQSIIEKAIDSLEISTHKYSLATEELEVALELKKLAFIQKPSFETTFSEVVSSHRLDSNHFKPKFDQLLHHIKTNFEYIHLGTSVVLNRRGVQPIYIPNGSKKVVTSQHITDTHLDYDNLERTSDLHYLASPEAHVKYGDILTYTTGAYVGQTNIYLDTEPALASNHVNIIRMKGSDIDPTYIAFVMNSLVGQLQTEKHIRGSAQAELYPNDMAKFIIPILDRETMASISQNVKDSLEARRNSKELLEQAKQEVETLIEQAAQTA